jgi:hypothetical protein
MREESTSWDNNLCTQPAQACVLMSTLQGARQKGLVGFSFKHCAHSCQGFQVTSPCHWQIVQVEFDVSSGERFSGECTLQGVHSGRTRDVKVAVYPQDWGVI